MKTIIYISHEGNLMKGSTYSLLNLINSVSENIRPVIIVPSDGIACAEFKKKGIKYYIVPFNLTFTEKHGIKRILTFLPRYIRDRKKNNAAAKIIKQIVIAEGAHIIHTNTAAVDVGQKVATELDLKHVWHLREFLSLDFSLNPLIGWKLFLKKINKADTIICITKSVCEHYKMVNNKKAYVIFNAVRPYNKIHLNLNKENYFLFCGAVTAQKGIEDALMAFSKFSKTYPDFKMVVAGTVKDNYAGRLSKLLKELQIDENVQLTGFKTDVDDLMANAKCLLMCSKNEALGRVTIEAMYNGCPVIGFAAGGTLEILENNRTGYLYNTMDELVEKMFYVIANKTNVTQLISQAQEYAQNTFSEEKYADSLMKIYDNLLLN